jgi:cyanophycinase
MMVACLPTRLVMAQAPSTPAVAAIASSASSNLVSSKGMPGDSVVVKPLEKLDAESSRTLEGPGSLLLCGGNQLPSSILDTFFERGGKHHGRLVIIPTASPRSDLKDYTRWLQMWDAYAWQSVHIVNVANTEEADREEVLQLIRDATAVWISGGEQQRLVERYGNTRCYSELLNVLNRGAIVGGTSAGAAVISNNMIAEGVDTPVMRKGWGILPGAIVDQHFSQRNRFARLSQAVASFPDHVGVGIDESTGLLIDRTGVQVLGQGAVHVYRFDKGQGDIVESTQYVAGSAMPNMGWNKLVTWQANDAESIKNGKP